MINEKSNDNKCCHAMFGKVCFLRNESMKIDGVTGFYQFLFAILKK